SGLKPIATIEAAKVSIAEMSTEDLTRMRSAFAKYPSWREMPTALIRADLRQELEARLKATQPGEALKIAVTPDNCADGINAGVTNTDISVSKALEIAGNIVMESLPTDALTFEGHAAASVALGLLQSA